MSTLSAQQTDSREDISSKLIEAIRKNAGKHLRAFSAAHGLVYCLDPLKALKEVGVRTFANTEAAKMDIVPQRYEGGFKVWECELRGAAYLEASPALQARTRSARVAELGCGAGLIGVLSLKLGAARVLFQDYNAEVLEAFTRTNVRLNLPEAADRAALHATSWEAWAERLGRSPVEERDRFDLVWGADILYETANYPTLIGLVCGLMARAGRAVIVSKVFYFGNSGDVLEFKRALDADGRLELEAEVPLSDSLGSAKVVLIAKTRSLDGV